MFPVEGYDIFVTETSGEEGRFFLVFCEIIFQIEGCTDPFPTDVGNHLLVSKIDDEGGLLAWHGASELMPNEEWVVFQSSSPLESDYVEFYVGEEAIEWFYLFDVPELIFYDVRRRNGCDEISFN